jgi:hypothetical protein
MGLIPALFLELDEVFSALNGFFSVNLDAIGMSSATS